MKPAEFQKWVARADGLAPFQRRRALDALAAPDPDRASHGVIEERIFHIQNVNAYDSRLKGWMQRFNGVASSYLGWRRFFERHKEEAANPKSWLIEALEPAPRWVSTFNANRAFLLPRFAVKG